MKIGSIISPVAALSLLICAQAIAANDYSPLIRTKKFAEAEKLANAKLAQEPANAEALVAKIKAILGEGPASRLEEAVKLGEQCVAAHPKQSECHEAYGNAMAAKAIDGGIMSAISSAGTMRDAFKKAVELDPRNFDARYSLLQFYLQAPGIAGGGVGKAQDLVSQTAAINPVAAKLLSAHIDLSESRLPQAEATAMAVQPGNDEALADNQRDLLANLGTQYLAGKKYADSERVFRNVQKLFPDSEWGLYGLARIQQEQGRHREAIAGFEQSLAVFPKAATYYRIGLSAMALNDKAMAASSFERALSFKSGLSKKMRADAQSQLKASRG
ncbi:tetratricopeptide repeat protein [Massilia horti]|uniref:Tetratricopeptide repeat protein n=1 Tax=Massilia horti TaxID=2562153 RepID=A0A4Y9SWA9_9BURK|nr:tetratricopeptide repeat protein [Massilia horti]TFW31014.1 tetratricopeptide repeat protein [Massilia horti]